ncbi:MAG: AsmA family protein, partial [Rhodobacteraceae bacterium]|nr:AsmA family protein [Paracoccaceae bacterium]
MALEQIQTPKPEPAETTVVRKWRPLRWLLAFVVLCFGAIAVGLSQLPGRSLSMPVWLQERVENRIAEAYPNLDIRFRSVMLVIGEQWHPSIALQDVELRDTDQSHLLSFPDVGVSLSPEALLSGRISLKAVRMSGAFVTLRRDPEGHFNVAMDRTRKTRTLTSLLAAVDSALQRPALAEFDEFLLTNLTMRYEDNRVARNWN